MAMIILVRGLSDSAAVLFTSQVRPNKMRKVVWTDIAINSNPVMENAAGTMAASKPMKRPVSPGSRAMCRLSERHYKWRKEVKSLETIGPGLRQY